MWRAWTLLVVALAGLGGCLDQQALLKKIVPEEEDRQARHFLTVVRDGNQAEARGMLGSSFKPDEIGPGLETLRTLFNQSRWVEVETIGYMKNWSAGPDNQRQVSIRLDYQIKLERHWVAGTVVFREEAGARKVISARFNPLPDSLATTNALTFSHKSLLHGVVLFFALLVPIFCLGTLVACIRSRIRRKWLWGLFILLPVGTFTLNWSTGDWHCQLLGFMLFGASLFKSGLYEPWILSVAFPLGALIFTVRRAALIRAAAEPVPPAPAP